MSLFSQNNPSDLPPPSYAMNTNHETVTSGCQNQRISTAFPIDESWRQESSNVGMEIVSPVMSPTLPSANGLYGAFSHPLSGSNDVHSTQAVDRNDSNSVLLESELTTDQTDMTTTERGYFSWRRWFTWKVSTRNILSICFLVTIPMVAFTTTILWLIFGNMLNETACPYPELCPNLSGTNGTDFRNNYYVDFPATRLVFIASWSSSLSLALGAALMSIYSYAIAAQFRQISEFDQPTNRLPTPYQMTLIFHVLNAELMTLLNLVMLKLKGVFWDRQRNEGAHEQSPLLRASVIVFASGVFTRYDVSSNSNQAKY
jgi:hypothetical protein